MTFDSNGAAQRGNGLSQITRDIARRVTANFSAMAPDYEATSLSDVTGSAADVCRAVMGRRLSVRRSESGSSPCNEDAILEGIIVPELLSLSADQLASGE